MVKKILKRIFVIILIILLPVCTYFTVICAIKHRDTSIQYVSYTIVDVMYAKSELQKEYSFEPLSNRVYRNALEEELKLKWYYYDVVDLGEGLNGLSNCYYRTIKIHEDLEGYWYCKTMCHEMIHLKYLTGDETYTSYMTFVRLYESDNEILRRVGAWYGLNQIENRVYGEYNCRDYVISYFKEKA